MSSSSFVASLACAAALIVPFSHAEAAGRKIVLDCSRLESFDTSGFTQHLTSIGWTVGEIDVAPITTATLSGYDVLLVPVAYSGSPSAFDADELAAVSTWVAQGHGLWLLRKSSSDPTAVNQMAGTNQSALSIAQTAQSGHRG